MVLHEILYALYSSTGSYCTVECDPLYLVFRHPSKSYCVSPACYVINDMFVTTSPQDS